MDNGDRTLSIARAEPRQGEGATIESPGNSTNQNEALTRAIELSNIDNELLQDNDAHQSSRNEGTRELSSDGAASPDCLCEDETRTSGELYLHKHTHTVCYHLISM